MPTRDLHPGARRSPTGTAPRAPEELPYRIELWMEGKSDAVERVLARAASAELARAIFKAAMSEHPQRRVTLRKGNRLLADSAG
jgi:hypothetical protein